MRMLFNATIEDKTFKILNLKAFREYTQQFKEGEDLVLSLERKKRNRSGQQNNYYWGVVLDLIARHTGHSSNELHEIYKRMFLPHEFITYNGKEIRVPGSTANLNTLTFGEYLDKIIAEAGSMGISIPPAEYI